MSVLKLELKLTRLSFLIWTGALSLIMVLCVVIYPFMEQSMQQLEDMFADLNMGDLYGNFMSYFGAEFTGEFALCSALFAALTGVRLLSKEESGHTAEFLLTHPISRCRIVTEKLMALVITLILFNLVSLITIFGSILLMGVTYDATAILLLFLANFILQLQLGSMAFGLSSVMRRGSIGAGLGLGVGMYFLNIIASLTEELEFLKNFTPFGYANGNTIVQDKTIDFLPLAIGLALAVCGVIFAYSRYSRKDIH